MNVPPPSSDEIREEMVIEATPEHVRSCILSPHGILQYYPLGIEAEHFEPGESFYCKGKLGISLFQVLCADADYVLLNVHNATSCERPYTAAGIKDAAFFSMLEDWYLEPDPKGTKLTRLWRGFRHRRLLGPAVRFMVGVAAKLEARAIRRYWAE